MYARTIIEDQTQSVVRTERKVREEELQFQLSALEVA
jgi:hypothetical protein